ncbi:pepsin-like aspartic protease [Alteromonas sp. H39]|uniref:pepsin-like aspartic protease n=1 Tax=Alteromonas sp. H39 TaxID=3389876 RepID=UPI0039E1EB85
MKSFRVPLTNVFAKGGYTARISISGTTRPVNVILDTGSSVLAIKESCYQKDEDKYFSPTSLAQCVEYGSGGWYGPVVKTRVTVGLPGHRVVLDDVELAIACEAGAKSFLQADGILGLAFTPLDQAFDVSDILTEQGISPLSSYPYILQEKAQTVSAFSQALHQLPKAAITPYFTQLEETGAVIDQFALLTHRSSVFQTDKHRTVDDLISHHLNHGLCILGKPFEHVELYRDPVYSVPLLYDKYYNVKVTGVRVGELPEITVPELDKKHQSSYVSNGIVDSGASMLVMPSSVLDAVKQALSSYHSGFEPLLAAYGNFTGEEVGVPLNTLKLEIWPDIHLILKGQGGQPVTLTLKPDTYWQIHAPTPNQATFKLCSLDGWPNQMILGLPLLNNYYTIFDRKDGENGCVHFAHKVDVPGHIINAVALALRE